MWPEHAISSRGAMMIKREAIVRPLLLACLVAIGTGVVICFAVVWSVPIGEQLLGPEKTRQSLLIQEDGTPLISSSPSAYRSQAGYTLEGVEVPGDEPIRALYGASFPALRTQQPALFSLGWELRIVTFADDRRPATYWYFVHDGKLDGSGCFVGFDSASKSRVGYIGARGFRLDQPPPEERIPVDGRLLARGAAFGRTVYLGDREPYYGWGVRTVHIISADRLLEVDLRKRSIRTVMEHGDMLGVSELSRPLSPPAKENSDDTRLWRSYVAIRTPDRVFLLDKTRHTQRSYLLPPQVGLGRLAFYEIADGLALVDVPRDIEGDTWHDLFWIDTAGKTLRHEEVLLETASILDRPKAAAWIGAGPVWSPIVVLVLVPLVWLESSHDLGQELTLVQAYQRAVEDTWLPLVTLFAVAGAMAWLCYRRQRRYAQPWTAVWVTFVFLGGIPALLGYLWHRRWPVRLPCPACQQRVPRDRPQCPECGTEFPLPASKGTEVFA